MEGIKYIQEIEQEEKNYSFDPDRFKIVFKKLLPWVVFLLIGILVIGYLMIRYTKPLYESRSELKLNIKRDASLLGLQEYDEEQTFNSLSSEMELLRSKLFFNKIIDALGLEVSIYTIGKVLLDERYMNPPFMVDYKIKDQRVYDIPFRVDIIDLNSYQLSYTLEGQHTESMHSFGEKIQTDHFEIILTLTDHYRHGMQDSEFYFYLNSRQSLLEYISENISVQPLNLNANTIQISFKDYNRQKARDMVNAIDTIYLKYTQEEKNKANSQKIRFLDQQLESTEQKLSDFEGYFENTIIRNKSIDLSSNLEGTIEQLSALDSQKYNLQNRLNRMKVIRNELIAGEQVYLGLSDFRMIPKEIINDIQKMNEMVERRESVLISHNTNTQAFRKWSDEIHSLHERISTFFDEYILEIQSKLEFIDEESRRLEQKFVELPSKNTEFSKSQRQYALYEEFYLSLMQKKAEFQLAMAGTVTDFKILSVASFPEVPLKPQPFMIYGISLVSWGLLTFFILGIGYLSFNKLTGLKELEKLTDIPILGEVPYYSREKLNISKIVINGDPKSAFSEALRSIRTNMQFILPGRKGVIISISSTVSGEGKTMVGLNLSSVMALTGKKVLIMDMDLRKPKFQKVFGDIPEDKGISTLLIGKDKIEDCIIHSNIENLDLLPSGPIPPNPSELIMSEKSDEMFQHLKEEYDMIFMDTPPIGIVTDGLLVMKKADLKLFIIRADYSKRIFVSYLKKINQLHQFDHLYIILNGEKHSRGVHYGYGYGSGYYHDPSGSRISKWFNRRL